VDFSPVPRIDRYSGIFEFERSAYVARKSDKAPEAKGEMGQPSRPELRRSLVAKRR